MMWKFLYTKSIVFVTRSNQRKTSISGNCYHVVPNSNRGLLQKEGAKRSTKCERIIKEQHMDERNRKEINIPGKS